MPDVKKGRVLLKLSGEALAGEKKTGFDPKTVLAVADEVKKLHSTGTQIGVVIGGGNFWRGRTGEELTRSRADQIGMLATIMNCIYVSDIFRSKGMETEILTPFVCGSFTKLYSIDLAEEALSGGKVVFFAGGTGHPYFSTDTGAVLRAIEIGADRILLAKAIDGVYSADPKVDPSAVRYDTIPIGDVISKKLTVIDLTASILAMENHMPMRVFALQEKDSILHAATGEGFVGTDITV